MKHIFTAITLLLLLAPSTLATVPLPFPTDIYQGKTIKIEVPQYDDQAISGTFDGKTVNFYEIARAPEWNEVITRAEFLKLLFDNTEFDTTPSATTPDFPDIPENHEYYSYVRMAQNLGIVSGYEDGTFGPNDPLARSHIAKILVEAYEPKTSTEEIQTFEDVTPDHWHYDYINQAVAAGYFEGYHDGLMHPNRDIIFDEAEIVIRRATNLIDLNTIDQKKYSLAYIGIHRLADIGSKKLTINTDTTNNYSINILDREFPTQSFYLPETKTELFGATQQNNTWTMINEAKANPHPEQLWEEAFIVPAEGVLTLTFGDTLYINDKFAGSHFGLDYANIEGTPVNASNSGIVTLADETMSYGNTIIIDHGQNVFTMYLHLSEIKVKKDQQVEKGQLIGLMGSTGIATGPHLHFTHFIGDIIVDSQDWYDETF